MGFLSKEQFLLHKQGSWAILVFEQEKLNNTSAKEGRGVVKKKEMQPAIRNNRHILHNPGDVVTAPFPSHISPSVTQQMQTLQCAEHPTPCTRKSYSEDSVRI